MLSPYEKETIISFSEAPEAACVYTYNRQIKAALSRLEKSHPEKVVLDHRSDGGVCYHISKELIGQLFK